jgi:hypothetical protein
MTWSAEPIAKLISALADVKTALYACCVAMLFAFLVLITLAQRSKDPESIRTIAWCSSGVFGLAVLIFFAGAIMAPKLVRVLWVDHDPINNNESRRVMRNLGGFEISDALSAESALEKLKHGNYDVVIARMDLLPPTDGVETGTVSPSERSPAQNYIVGQRFLSDVLRQKGDLPIIVYDHWFAESEFVQDGKTKGTGVLVTNDPFILIGLLSTVTRSGGWSALSQ